MTIPVGEEIKSPEKWTLLDCIPYYPQIYWISTWGRLLNALTKNYLPKKYMEIEDNKYVSVSLSFGSRDKQICMDLHRLVMMQFCPHPFQNTLEIDHLDGIKYHNWIWNMEWVTHEENIRRAVERGSFIENENKKSRKITKDQAEYICQLIDKGLSSKQVAQIVNFGQDINIEKIYFNIKCGYSWKFIADKYDFSKKWTNRKGSTTSA